MIALPQSHNNYCSVCKDTYKEYFEHIESKIHKDAVKGQAPIHQKIDELINQINMLNVDKAFKVKQNKFETIRS